MSRAGFSLVEILMSLGIFLLGFVSVMGLFIGGFKTQEVARSHITESLVAESLFETLKEAEHPVIKSELKDISGPTKLGIRSSECFPGYCYFYTVEPYGTGQVATEWEKLFVTIYVFEAKFTELYEQNYDDLSEEEKEQYDRNCLKCYTIVDMELED